MRLIKGNINLAKEIGVSERTISRWKHEGLLSKSIIGHIRRTIIYDFDIVLSEINVTPLKRGRKTK